MSEHKVCHMPKPCVNCPFKRDGGIRLRTARVLDLAENAAGNFPCHKTTNNDNRDQKSELECTGAIIFAYKAGVTMQMLRISERLGMIDPTLADDDHPEIFDSIDEMLATAVDAKPASRRSRSRSPR